MKVRSYLTRRTIDIKNTPKNEEILHVTYKFQAKIINKTP